MANNQEIKENEVNNDNTTSQNDIKKPLKPPKNLLSELTKKSKKSKKKAIKTRVRNRNGEIYEEIIKSDGTTERKFIGKEILPQYLTEQKAKELCSFIYDGSTKKWKTAINIYAKNKSDDGKESKDETKDTSNNDNNNDNNDKIRVMSYNIWFAKKKWKERGIKLLQMVKEYNPDIFCFQEVTPRFMELMCDNEYIRKCYELTDNTVGSTVIPVMIMYINYYNIHYY